MSVLTRWREAAEQSLVQPHRSIESSQALETALVLTVLLIVFVPVLWLVMGISSLFLVPFAGLLYGGYLFWTNQLLVGIGSGFFVLVTFNANIPLVAAPGATQGEAYLFDILLLAVTALCAYWHWQYGAKIPHLGRIAIGALGLFVAWSVLAAFFGAGPSTLAGLIFSVEQFRYFIILVATALYVRYTDLRCVIYPLLIAVGGHTVFAFAQAYNGSIFGMSYLGESNSRILQTINIGPIVYDAGLHTGGFAGTGRVLIGLLILLSPVVFVYTLSSWRRTSFGFLAASIAGVVVLMGDTDAGWGAFVLAFGILSIMLGATYWRNGEAQYQRGALFALPVVVLNTVLREWQIVENMVANFVSRVLPSGGSEPASTPSQSAGASNGSSGGGTGSATEGGTSSTTEGITSPAAAETTDPTFVDTSTLGIRMEQYTSALDIGARNPLFGLGGSNFNIIAPTYGLPEGMTIHNTYLAYLAETGIPGLFLFMISITSVILILFRTGYSVPHRHRRLAIGIGAGIIGFLGVSFWSNLYTVPTVMGSFWILCGVTIGMYVEQGDRATT